MVVLALLQHPNEIRVAEIDLPLNLHKIRKLNAITLGNILNPSALTIRNDKEDLFKTRIQAATHPGNNEHEIVYPVPVQITRASFRIESIGFGTFAPCSLDEITDTMRRQLLDLNWFRLKLRSPFLHPCICRRNKG